MLYIGQFEEYSPLFTSVGVIDSDSCSLSHHGNFDVFETSKSLVSTMIFGYLANKLFFFSSPKFDVIIP